MVMNGSNVQKGVKGEGIRNKDESIEVYVDDMVVKSLSPD